MLRDARGRPHNGRRSSSAEDVAILLDRRLIARDADGKLVVPYDSLRLEGEISTRAA